MPHKSKYGKITWFWIKTPDISSYSFIKRKKYNYLDLFYYFGQFLVPKGNIKRNQEIKSIIIDLDNRVNHLLFFANEIKKFEKN